MAEETATRTAHTPGPWGISQNIARHIDTHGRLHITIEQGSLGVFDVVAKETPEAEADARLIAAAPELLIECRLALEALDELYASYVNGVGAWGYRASRSRDQLAARIAKATGASS